MSDDPPPAGVLRLRILTAALALLGPLAFLWSRSYPTLGLKLQTVGALAAAVLLVPYLAAAWLAFRGRPGREFPAHVALAVAALPLLCIGLLVAANGALDSSAPVRTGAWIVGVGDGIAELHVDFEDRCVTLRVASVGTVGDRHDLQIGRGALGEPWVR